MILCLVFLGLYVARMDESPTVSLFELIINVLFWVFWLSTAAVLSSMVSDINGAGYFGGWTGDADKFRASCAFGWMTFFLWTASTALGIMETLKGRKGPPPSVPAAPAVAMV
jgi:Membrane-associating domain